LVIEEGAPLIYDARVSFGHEGPVGPDAASLSQGPCAGEDLIVEVHILSGTRTGDRVALLSPERVRLGRDPGAEVAFPRNGDVVVSHRHAELRREDGGYVLSPAPSETVPFGKYVLTGRLGQGGMAEVYLARQQGLGGFDRQVVLKLIRPELHEVASVSAMLLDEARIVAEISHPNVVQVHDVGEEHGVLYIAMEYLLAERGVTLYGRPPRPLGAGLLRWMEPRATPAPVSSPPSAPRSAPTPPVSIDDATQLDVVLAPVPAPPDEPASGPVAEAPAGALIEPPPPGEVLSRRTAAGDEVLLRSLWLRQGQDRDPVPLLLCGTPGLLPAPLLVSLGAGSLIVELARSAAAARPAPAIYLDAHAPSTRRESYLIAASLRGAGFDVGHRRARVQRVHVESVVRDGGPGPLRLDAPALELALGVPEAGLLAVLYTIEPRPQDEARGGMIHALCVIVT
jgi:hypothetical protein